MTWSYSELVKEHGEERALELLSVQKGYGRYGEARHAPRVTMSNTCWLCGEPWSSKKSCGPVDTSILPRVSSAA